MSRGIVPDPVGQGTKYNKEGIQKICLLYELVKEEIQMICLLYELVSDQDGQGTKYQQGLDPDDPPVEKMLCLE